MRDKQQWRRESQEEETLAGAQPARSRRRGHFNQLHSKRCRGGRAPRENPDSGLKARAEAPCAPDHVCPAEENTNKNASHLLHVRHLHVPRSNLRRKSPPASPRPSTVLAQILSLPGPEPGLLTGARCVRAPGPSPAPVRPLPHQSSFCEHLHLQASSSAPRSSSSFLPVAHRVCALRTRSCTRSRARGFGDRGGAHCTVSRLLFAASVRTLWLALSLTTCYGSPPSVLTCYWFTCYVLLFSWFL